MQWPTSEEINSVLRHVYTGVSVLTATLAAVGLSQGNVTALGQAIHQIGDGVASIAIGVGTLIPIASALYAAYKQSPWSKMMHLNNSPDIKQVFVKPGTPLAVIADAIPGNKITTAPDVTGAPAGPKAS